MYPKDDNLLKSHNSKWKYMQSCSGNMCISLNQTHEYD
jgi:hypothetical protein